MLPGRFLAMILLAALPALVTPDISHARVTAQAVTGRPFGVARITVPLEAGAGITPDDTQAIALTEPNGRVLYPVFSGSRALKLLGTLLGNQQQNGPLALTVLFLFTGDQPLDLTIYTPEPQTVRVTSISNGRQHQRLLNRWWRQYNAGARQRSDTNDYPLILDTYLTTMLAQRLRLAPPLLSRQDARDPGTPRGSLELLAGTEEMRAAIMRQTLSGRVDGQTADLPVPDPIAWAPLTVPAADPKVDIEPIAMHVPEECFYVHFGRFNNYLWLSHLQKDYGGDLGQMITLRGHNANLNERVQRQLALKESVLAELLGEQVIADVAMLGRDMFLKEGAAMGMLFQARNSALLGSQIGQERRAALAKEKQNGATNKTVKIAGHDVSFLSTPDNRLRSYHAIDGVYHLVTTSRAIVERFYQVGQGQGSLGASPQFRHARSVMPTSRKDTVFVYMSSAFFQGLLSPQYRIELRRRLQAVTDLELVQLARLTARAERQPGDTIEDLVSAGLLPLGFGRRADGAGPIVEDRRSLDSLRGARGTFIPVPDVPLRGVTQQEAREYAEVAAFHGSQWKQMDPLMIGIKRYALNKTGLERIVIDARVSPFDEGKYGQLASRLGPPLKNRIAPAPGDIISVQAVVKAGLLKPEPGVHHLFLGVQDFVPQGDTGSGGLLTMLRLMRSSPGYLGAWPKPGYLDRLPLGLAPQPDARGYSRMLFGLWRRELNGFSVLSFDPRVLETVVPQLRLEETDSAAQIRIHVGDLSKAKIAQLSNSMAYMRTRQSSIGNARLLAALNQQLHVPPAEALATAETLLDAKLVCTLGGQYQLAEHAGGHKSWVSTAWADQPSLSSYRIPADFHAPLLKWFRGVDAELVKQQDKLVVHAELDMQRKERNNKIQLPLFNLFGNKKKDAAKGKPEEIRTPPRKEKKAREF